MFRHHRAEQIQLERQIRMSRRNHLVIDGLLFRSEVATQTSVAADGDVSQIAHPKLIFLRRRAGLPLSYRVRPEPSCGWAVAMLAADPVADIEALSAHLRRHRKRMARETFLVLARR